ncbi:MAG: hypothetical protein PHW84_02010 [Methanosarcina sp.]|nr:hypothetical protein [Methanosarcina sp.]
MTQQINLVQGFKGEITHQLNFNGVLIDVSDATKITFNFSDRCGKTRYSIRCNKGESPYEVKIPISNEAAVYGEFYGEFVIKRGSKVDIYPLENKIPVSIRKCI